jgi:hypothetical protein
MMKQVFPIIPASGGPLWVIAALVAAVLIGITVLFVYLAYSSRSARFEVSDEGLRISGDLYGRLIPARDLNVEAARVLNLNEDAEHRPKWRTNGTGLPGYQAGWFRLQNGEKSLLFITDRSRVVYLPTRQDYSVILSVAQPEALIESLRMAVQR